MPMPASATIFGFTKIQINILDNNNKKTNKMKNTSSGPKIIMMHAVPIIWPSVPTTI